jgi:hypothetical protein
MTKILPAKFGLLLLLAAGSGLFFTACEKETKEGKLKAVLTASATSGSPGDTITLDASASEIPDDGTFFYFSSLTGTEGVDYRFIDMEPADNKRINVLLMKPSLFTLMLRLEHSATGRVESTTVDIQISGARRLSGNISADIILEDLSGTAVADYYVAGIIQVSARLHLKPGVHIEFAENAGFHIVNGGEIYCENNNDFSFALAGGGNGWRGIYVEKGRFEYNELNVKNGGYSAWPNGHSAAILVGDEGALRSVQGASSKYLGFVNSWAYDVKLITENAVINTNGGMIGYSISPGFCGYGNHLNNIPISGSSLFEVLGGEINGAVNLNGDLLFTGDVEIVQNNTSMNVGKKIYVAQGKSIVVRGTINTFIGSVIFEGYMGARWKGIYYMGNGTRFEISNVTIKHAGWRETGSSEVSTGLSVLHGELSANNCHFENPGGYGIWVPHDLQNLSNSTFTNCAIGAGVNYKVASRISDDNSFNILNNGPGVSLFKGTGVPTGGISFKRLPGSWYAVTENMEIVDGVIQQGCRFKVSQGVTIYISSSFNAEGTVADSIIFEGRDPSAGYWNGLSVNTSSQFKVGKFRVSHGGRGFMASAPGSSTFASEKANIAFFSTPLLGAIHYFRDGKVTGSAGYGIFLAAYSGAVPISYFADNNVAFAANASADVVKL